MMRRFGGQSSLVRALALGLAVVAMPAGLTSAAGEPATAKADALLTDGDFQGAAAAYESVLAEEPGNPGAWFGLGQARHNLERFEAAAEAYARALDLGFQPAPRAMFHAARAHASLGDAPGAVAWLEKIVAAGVKPYLGIRNTPELAGLAGNAAFDALLASIRPCSGPEYRQFDFWIGDWEVVSQAAPPGQPPAHNRISGVHGGCVLREEYDTPGGYTGTSLSFYDAANGRWHQTWIDNQGQPLFLTGGLVDGSMVLSDTLADGKLNRVTWTPLEDGTVRQHWQATSDGGETWNTVFDGIYRPRKADE